MDTQSNSPVKSLDEISLEIAKNGKVKVPFAKDPLSDDVFQPDEEIFSDGLNIVSKSDGNNGSNDAENKNGYDYHNKREELEVIDSEILYRRNMGKIHFQRVNEETGREVKWEDIGKAYKLNDKYILLDDEDFENAAPEKSKIIEVNHFVKETEIDTIYYENSYYIEPEKSGLKAYALLREALEETEKVGIAQFVMRTAEVLTVLKPYEKILLLSKIRFAEEIRSTKEFNLPPSTVVKPSELKVAISLINQYTGKFNISKFKDEYSASLLKVIKSKSKGKKSASKKPEITHTKTQDLMEQLRASLKKAS